MAADNRRTEAETTPKVIQYLKRFEMRKAFLWAKSCQSEKRAIGNDDVGDRVYRSRIRTMN